MANILLTSFQTWLPHQKSNSSDDLLAEVAKLDFSPHSLTFLRHLPVDIAQASEMVISQINELQPDIIVCCGMAESRCQLTIESQACNGEAVLQTFLDLDSLVDGLLGTSISHNAGKFVCEGLYYSVLNYLLVNDWNKYGLFVHVPVLKRDNFADVLSDFQVVLQRLAFLGAVEIADAQRCFFT